MVADAGDGGASADDEEHNLGDASDGVAWLTSCFTTTARDDGAPATATARVERCVRERIRLGLTVREREEIGDGATCHWLDKNSVAHRPGDAPQNC